VASYLETAIDIAREAGALLSTYFERRVGFELKGDFDLVTVADRASEHLVVERLRQHFPSHSIVAEEGGGHQGSSGFRWYVDPLDGTTNFAHGYPIYNVTMGLEQDGEMLVGVVFDPTRQEMFSAERGAGAYLNNRRIHVSTAKRLEDSLVSTGFPSRKRHLNVNIHFYHQMAMATHGVRRGGSAAIDLAYVACGRLEAFWEFGLNPWDMAAGTLLVTEAGGRCTDMNGGPHSITGPHLLTDNGAIHQETVDLFSEIFRGQFRVPMPVI
ncbi:MAG TPA: inositol monophosphatase family protein, partial [Bryobacteraceae bacterium]|nr:inositol monophosphatase family protein [Bryobacteraceae bacterium]